MKLNKKEEWFKVRYSQSGEPFTCKCVEKYGSIWMNYADAKKEYDKMANPKVVNKETISWVELTYFPEDAEDETIIESWELTQQQKWFVEFAKSL